MLISGRTQAQESRYQRAKILRVASRFEPAIAREITRAMNDAASKLDDPLSESPVRLKHTENMTKILTRLWDQSGESLIEGTFTIAKSFLKMELKRDITTPIMDEVIADWIRAYGGERITEITRTTQNDIAKIVADARQEGLSERETAKLIREIAPIKSASRTQTIARTEAHASSQGMSLDVAGKTQIPMVKVWLTSVSERTREAHIDANGQRRALAQPFDVDGEQLEYPGDPSGSAENTINCRCVVGYEVA